MSANHYTCNELAAVDRLVDATLSYVAPLRLHLPEYHRVNFTLVGCGGTGSHLASGLVAIAQALAERNARSEMLFVDPDVVEEKNVGRQLFAQSDIGRNKAHALVRRLNSASGRGLIGYADFLVRPQDIAPRDGWLNIVVGAVDNGAARSILAEAVQGANGALWWLDCGNDNLSGQVALGNCATASDLQGSVALGMIDRLPAPHLLWPDLVAAPKAARGAPSCAELTAAGEQGLMVNRMVAAWALALLHDFLLGDLRWFALAFDLGWGGTRAYTLDAPTLAEACGLKQRELEAKK